MTARITATTRETALIYNALTLHLKRVPGTDYFIYETGWSDEAIIKEVSPEGRLKPSHAAYMRGDVFGTFPPSKGGRPMNAVETAALESRLSSVEATVAAQEATVLDIAAKFNSMLNYLSDHGMLPDNDLRRLKVGD